MDDADQRKIVCAGQRRLEGWWLSPFLVPEDVVDPPAPPVKGSWFPARRGGKLQDPVTYDSA
jgi:hypothetical protein